MNSVLAILALGAVLVGCLIHEALNFVGFPVLCVLHGTTGDMLLECDGFADRSISFYVMDKTISPKPILVAVLDWDDRRFDSAYWSSDGQVAVIKSRLMRGKKELFLSHAYDFQKHQATLPWWSEKGSTSYTPPGGASSVDAEITEKLKPHGGLGKLEVDSMNIDGRSHYV